MDSPKKFEAGETILIFDELQEFTEIASFLKFYCWMVDRNLGVYKGALYENIVGEALIKCGYDLCYCKRMIPIWKKFFVRTKEHLVPVEVNK